MPLPRLNDEPLGNIEAELYAALESLPCTVRDEVDAAIAKARGES